MSYNLQVWAKI